jgi:uncharacterized protein YbjT (DUF2867 family)
MVVVTGATGTIGRHLVKHLERRGVEPKAVVRTEARGRTLGVPYVVADLDDPGSLARAFEGATRLFLNGPVDVAMARQQKAAVDAARAAGVARLVRVSAAGSSPTSDRAVNAWHAEIDAHAERSGIPAALLRPTFFTQNLLKGAAGVRAEAKLHGAFGSGRLAFVDTSDIAECGAVLLTQAEAPHGAFVVTGPEALSFAEVAERLSARLGRRVAYVDRPAAAVVEAMKARGMAPPIAESFGKMMEAFARGEASEVTPAVRALTGHPARSVDDFLDEHLDQFR